MENPFFLPPSTFNLPVNSVTTGLPFLPVQFLDLYQAMAVNAK
jgi:hypothetical protein